MCPHCIAIAIDAGIGSLVALPIGYQLLKSKFTKKKFSRQEAAKANFDVLYGKGPDMGRANPGYVAFQKAMKDE